MNNPVHNQISETNDFRSFNFIRQGRRFRYFCIPIYRQGCKQIMVCPLTEFDGFGVTWTGVWPLEKVRSLTMPSPGPRFDPVDNDGEKAC